MRRAAAAFALMTGILACRAGPPEPVDIPALVAALDDDRLEVRQKAERELLALDLAAAPHLERAERSGSPQAADAARRLLARIRSFPARLARWGNGKVRHELGGERWFVGYDDGQPCGIAYARLDVEEGYRFTLGFARKGDPGGLRTVFRRGTLDREFLLTSWKETAGPLDPLPGTDPVRVSGRDSLRVLAPHVLLWFLPWDNFRADGQDIQAWAVDGGNVRGPMRVRIEFGLPEKVPDPSGEKTGESCLVTSRDPGSDFRLGVWWDEKGRVIQVREDGVHYYPVSRDEALKASGGLEWWK